MNDPVTPNWRKPIGMLLILLIIGMWAVLITSLSGIVAGWPGVVQLLFYCVTGIVWILPVRPLLTWMENVR